MIFYGPWKMLSKLHLVIIQPKCHFHITRSICNLKKPLESCGGIHCYKNLYPWKSFSEFADHIVSSIVYNKHGIIAINKPFGVPNLKRNEEAYQASVKNVKHTAMYANQKEFQHSIEEVLPAIKSALGLSNLFIVKSTERYTSGLVLMATNGMTAARMQKSLNNARNRKIPYLLHYAVTLGYPVELIRKEIVGVKRAKIEGGEEKVSEIVTNMSQRDILRKIVKRFHVEYRTLSVNKDLPCSLMEIITSSINFHFVRLYASRRAASILGDQMFGSRRQNLFGLPINLDVQNAAAYNIQQLPDAMCEKLDIPFGAQGSTMVPSMIHLNTMILPKFDNKQDLHISAPLPHHFVWTCKQLELEL